MFQIRLAEKQEQREENTQMQSVMCFTQKLRVIWLDRKDTWSSATTRPENINIYLYRECP